MTISKLHVSKSHTYWIMEGILHENTFKELLFNCLKIYILEYPIIFI